MPKEYSQYRDLEDCNELDAALENLRDAQIEVNRTNERTILDLLAERDTLRGQLAQLVVAIDKWNPLTGENGEELYELFRKTAADMGIEIQQDAVNSKENSDEDHD